MITKFKIFENEHKPEIGDFIVLKDIDLTNFPEDKKEIPSWFVNKIGQIKDYNTERGHKEFEVYFDVPDRFGFNEDKLIRVDINNIKYFSKNKKDVESYIQTKKYNI